MKKIIFIALAFCLPHFLHAQKYMTRSGQVSFFSSTAVENIEAINNEVASVFDATSGELIFIVPIKSFKFDRALMQEHFNENYLESDTYPKATFKGNGDFSGVNFAADGNYAISVAGQLTMHGVTKDVSATANIKIVGSKIDGNTTFNVNPADYSVKIPDLVKGQISDKIEVTVKATLQPLK